MANGNGGGLRFLGREQSTRITEAKTGGVRGEVGIPILQAVAVSAWLPVALAVTGVAVWAAGPVAHWIVLVVVASATILYHIIYEQETWQRLAQVTLNACLLATVAYSVAKLGAWVFADARIPARGWVVALWCIAPGTWIGFVLLFIAFAWELFLRSPAMEEHGFREFSTWLFQVFLPAWTSRPRTQSLPKPVVTRVSFASHAGNGNVAVSEYELPVAPDVMTKIARAALAGVSFSEPGMCANGEALLSRPKFETLREAMLERGLVRWRDPTNARTGTEWTPGGWAFLREQAHPTPAGEGGS